MELKTKKPRQHVSQRMAAIRQTFDPRLVKRTQKKMLVAVSIIEGLEKKGWSKIQFAKQMNVQPSVITQWLSGAQNFTLDTLSDIEEVLGISLLNVSVAQKKEPVVYHMQVESNEAAPVPSIDVLKRIAFKNGQVTYQVCNAPGEKHIQSIKN